MVFRLNVFPQRRKGMFLVAGLHSFQTCLLRHKVFRKTFMSPRIDGGYVQFSGRQMALLLSVGQSVVPMSDHVMLYYI